MKKIITLAVVLTTVFTAMMAQAPSKFNYQAIVRNNSGIVVPNGTSVSFRFTIRDGSAGGTILYQETQTKTTNNAFGLVNLEIGAGTVQQGIYPTASQWGGGSKFLQVEIDPAGGNSFTNIGASQLNSVPYANFSSTSETANTASSLSGNINPNQINAGGGTTGQVLKFNGTNWVPGSDTSNSYYAGTGLTLFNDTFNSVWTEDGSNIYNNNTGNVGIGIKNPNFKLDVLHSGSSGILIKSTSSFSVLDIDAQSGDAAVRFKKDGINQWNLRNRPADNYFELFELGGGGSRIVIQDATGNLGVGETSNPKYKIDALFKDTFGLRVRSTGNGSHVDVDAFSGNAAIRFAKNGVYKWTAGNRAADDNFELFEIGGGGGSRLVVQNNTGNLGLNKDNPLHKLDVGGSINTSANLFVALNAGFGTTSPLGPFHIKKSSNNQFALNGSQIAFDPTDKTFDDSATFIIHSSLEIGVGAQTSLIAMGSDNGNYSSNLLFYTRGNITTDDPTEKMRITSTGNVGIGMTPSFQLQVATNSAAKPTSSAWTVPSDRRLKDEVGSFTDGLSVIMAIRPVKFRYNGLLGLPSEEVGIGTIAQELQEVAPYMVKINPSANPVNSNESMVNGKPNDKTSETEYLCVDYGAMNFVLINAIKEQQAQIEELRKEIEILKAKK